MSQKLPKVRHSSMALSDIEQKALDLLSLREHSRFELSRKLLSRGFERDSIDAVLDDLETRNFLNDGRFVESYVSYRSKRGCGPVKIRLELKDRGVNTTAIDNVLVDVDFDWFESAVEVRAKKFGIQPIEDLKEKAKVSRFLDYRGFESEQIRYAVEYENERN